MQAGRADGVFLALTPIALGHLHAMRVALLPFTLFWLYLDKVREIRAAAGALLLVFGIYKLVSQCHPRFLARIGPSHLVLWSFLMATAHDAGLMLVPVVLGLCTNSGGGHDGHQTLLKLAGSSLQLALAAVTVHTAAMVLTGGTIAWVVYRYVGLGLLRRGWLNFDLLWAVLLIAVGGIALAVASAVSRGDMVTDREVVRRCWRSRLSRGYINCRWIHQRT